MRKGKGMSLATAAVVAVAIMAAVAAGAPRPGSQAGTTPASPPPTGAPAPGAGGASAPASRPSSAAPTPMRTTGIARPDPANPLHDLREKHLANIRQLTFGGENAEAYFDYQGRNLIFQTTRDGRDCDQIYTMTTEGKNVRMVSTGRGRCTCSYFFPDGKRILYASTHMAADACPPKPDRSRGYVWALYDSYDIFTADPDGGNVKRIIDHPGYDAEATISEDGSRIVFTSMRDGDVDLYTMAPDGTALRRVTHEPGYDGGAFFSPDGKRLVYRASRPRTPGEMEDWQALLKDRLVRPTTLEIQVANADGSAARAVTKLGAASFGPYWFRDGRRIIFASNHGDAGGMNFDLYAISDDGTGLERITWNDTFDGFPMFTRDGKKLVFASNRCNAKPGETNVFIADWVP